MISFDRRRAWVVHTRPLRETSVVAELVVEGEGRVAAVYRKARGTTARPFVRYLVTARGRGDLPTLTQMEEGGFVALARDLLPDGLYLNELVVRLLPGHYHAPDLWAIYDESLRGLAAGDRVARLRFELRLLAHAGVGFDGGGGEVGLSCHYRFLADRLPEPVVHPPASPPPDIVCGATLRALAEELPPDRPPVVYDEAARLLRHLIDRQTGGRKMRAMELQGRVGN